MRSTSNACVGRGTVCMVFLWWDAPHRSINGNFGQRKSMSSSVRTKVSPIRLIVGRAAAVTEQGLDLADSRLRITQCRGGRRSQFSSKRRAEKCMPRKRCRVSPPSGSSRLPS
ncbi:hypothetical protein J2W30_003821 [Variovorax boronicumulans]|uniref:hypothetical protein n=1 Tax=Variovorax boronicumulans TaxID=436515 RepID=UPI002781685C|nr:hypothetical protein [Variovorax boronicumulans]MDQ0036048.1 hypothetical protein [Variovorax boronicumulans]